MLGKSRQATTTGAAALCPHRVPATSYCKRCDTGKAQAGAAPTRERKAAATPDGGMMSTDLAIRPGDALAEFPDAEAGALALLDVADRALEECETLEAAQSILAHTKVLEAATRAVKLTVKTISKAGALRVRSERRVGELLAADPSVRRGRPDKNSSPTRITDLGISHDESARFQRLAAIPEPKFEQALGEARVEAEEQRGGSIHAGAVLRKAQPEREKRPDEQWLDADRFIDRCKKLIEDAPAMLAAVRFGRYPAEEDSIVYGAALGIVGGLRDALAEIHTEIERRVP